MWNSNSRRWLVKQECAALALNHHTTTNTDRKSAFDAMGVIATNAQRRFRIVFKATQKRKIRKGRTRRTLAARVTKINATAAASAATTTLPCLNQILEVLLAILVANCLLQPLLQVPAAYAAFGAQYADMVDSDEVAAAEQAGEQARSSYWDSLGAAASRFGGGQFANYQRQAHSIRAGAGGSVGGYNGLQHPSAAAVLALPLQTIDDYALATSPNLLQRSQNFKISPKPCSIGRIEGTCMFVWECIKSEGRHVGMCVDSFMFGSCCAHNYTENFVLPQPFAYTRPTKPMGMSGVNHRPRPPHMPHKPSISGMTTIERPHGAGTLVIRPSGPHHQGALHKPHQTSTTTTTTTTSIATASSATEDPAPPWTSNTVVTDMQSAASVPSTSLFTHHHHNHNTNNIWHLHQPSSAASASASSSSSSSFGGSSSGGQQQHWHMTTEPNFITKPRPPSWEKPSQSQPLPLRPKPSKPPKKPASTATTAASSPDRPAFHQTRPPPAPSIVYSTRRPQPPHYTRPQHTTTTTTTTTHRTTTTTTTKATTRPYTRPTTPLSWASSESTPSGGGPYSTSSKHPTSTTTTSTTQKYRPTASSTSSSAAAHEATHRPHSSTSPASTTTSTSSSTAHATPTRPRPTPAPSSSWPSSSLWPSSAPSRPSSAAASSSSAVTTASYASTISQTSLLPHNLTTIESNEIPGGNAIAIAIASSIKPVKTVSAARSECGIPVLQRPETRIVGGKSAAFGRWPWQVSVRRTSFFGFSSTHRCGGALINENWIATAGHCVDDLLISQIRIRVGEYDFSHVQEQLPYIERGVAKKVVHPKYNFFTYEYDLALVKLEQPLEFAPHVSPICLPETDSLLIGMNATVTGWGRLSEGGTLPSVLQEVSVPIVSNDNCKSMFLRAGRQEFIPEIFLCAGYETGGQDSCQGDSGGPLQVKSQDGRFFLAGIISWGIGCAEANLPGVCTRISKFVPWIMENVT